MLTSGDGTCWVATVRETVREAVRDTVGETVRETGTCWVVTGVVSAMPPPGVLRAAVGC
jgi:hypothetical protein